MATKRKTNFERINIADLGPLRFPKSQGQGTALEGHWRTRDKRLAELPIETFRHMKICCPQCTGLPTGCEFCGESGLCCPTCNGANVVSKGWNGARVITLPCPTCQIELSDGPAYNEVAAERAIDRYIDDWFVGRIEDPVLTRRMEAEKERKERERTQTGRGLWKHG